MKRICAFLTAVVVSVMPLVSSTTKAQSQQQGKNEVLSQKFLRKGKTAIPSQYIIVLQDWATGERGEMSGAAETAKLLVSIYGGKVKHVTDLQ